MKAILTALALTATGAAAQENCGPVTQMLRAIQEEYGEHMYVRGFDAAGSMVGFFGNAETGTWTVLVVGPNGIACAPAYGGNFGFQPAPPAGERG